MSRQTQEIKIQFPVKGINLMTPKTNQPEGTCVDAKNVTVWDLIEDRARGGRRPGLVKYTANTAIASTRIQDINHVTTIKDEAPSATTINRRTITPVSVCGGNVYTFNTAGFTLSTGGTGALSNTAPFVFSAELFGKLYFADGVNVKLFTASTTTTGAWTLTVGTFPGAASNRPRLIEQWRARIVMSGVRTDPHNWFMSKLGDPLDFDYSPATDTEDMAFEGATGVVGKCGDIINSIVPYSEDYLILGGARSTWLMAGDPAAGGRIDMLSANIGMAFGRPWCIAPNGILYFFSNRGRIYSLSPDGLPEEVSYPIRSQIEDTNQDTNVVRMSWSNERLGFHVFITPLTAGAATHWFYDMRAGGWFKYVLANNNFNPVAVHEFDGEAASSRVTLIGGEDGFIRYFSDTAYDDSGTNTETYVTLGPFMSEGGKYPHILNEIMAVLDSSSGSVIYEILSGDSPDDALASAAGTFVGDATLAADRSLTFHPKERGYYTYIKFGTPSTNASNWALESIKAKLQVITSSKGRMI